MSLRDRVGHETPPTIPAEPYQPSVLAPELRMKVSPISYYRRQTDAGAILADQRNGTTTYTTGLAAVRNSPALRDAYDEGAALGTQDKYAGTGPAGVNEGLYEAIGSLLFEKFQRYRLDLLLPTSSKGAGYREQGSNEYYGHEIENVFNAETVSLGMKAVAIAELALTRTSTLIKNYADNAFKQLVDMTVPGEVFRRLYLGVGARYDQRGIGVYLGFYEALNNQTRALYRATWGDDAKVCRRTLGDALFLRTALGGDVALRQDKIVALEFVDQRKIEEARRYLQDLFLVRPEAFNILAQKSFFRGGLPQSVNPRTTREYYENRLFTQEVADQYCSAMRRLSAETILEFGAGAIDAVFGMARPGHMQQKWDVLHVVAMHTEDILDTLAYTSDPSKQTLTLRVGRGRSPDLPTTLLIAGLDLGFIVKLAENIAVGDIQNHASDLTRLLDEARKPPAS